MKNFLYILIFIFTTACTKDDVVKIETTVYEPVITSDFIEYEFKIISGGRTGEVYPIDFRSSTSTDNYLKIGQGDTSRIHVAYNPRSIAYIQYDDVDKYIVSINRVINRHFTKLIKFRDSTFDISDVFSKDSLVNKKSLLSFRTYPSEGGLIKPSTIATKSITWVQNPSISKRIYNEYYGRDITIYSWDIIHNNIEYKESRIKEPTGVGSLAFNPPHTF